jgi:hypothetical protein
MGNSKSSTLNTNFSNNTDNMPNSDPVNNLFTSINFIILLLWIVVIISAILVVLFFNINGEKGDQGPDGKRGEYGEAAQPPVTFIPQYGLNNNNAVFRDIQNSRTIKTSNEYIYFPSNLTRSNFVHFDENFERGTTMDFNVANIPNNINLIFCNYCVNNENKLQGDNCNQNNQCPENTTSMYTYQNGDPFYGKLEKNKSYKFIKGNDKTIFMNTSNLVI